jgi:amino acid transporter
MMSDLLSWDYLTSAPPEADVLSSAAILFAIVFAGGFLLSSIISYRPRLVSKYFRKRRVSRAAGISMWVFGIGLFFFLIRLMQINPITFGNRIWMVLMAIIVFTLIVWLLFAFGVAVRRGPLPVPKPIYSPRGYHAAPVRRPAKRGHI